MDQSAKSLAELLHIVATTTLHGGSDAHRRPLAAHVLLQAINEKVLAAASAKMVLDFTEGTAPIIHQIGQCLIDSTFFIDDNNQI